MTHIRFEFADGHLAILTPGDPVRLRSASAYGVQTCPASDLLAQRYPDGGIAADWLMVEVGGREHSFHGCRIQSGTLAPAPAPAALEALAAPTVPAPFIDEVAEMSLVEIATVLSVAPAPATKKQRKVKP